MDAVSYTEARATLATAIDRVCEDHEPLTITRRGKPSGVLLSLDDYESLDETAYPRECAPPNKGHPGA